MFYVFLDKINFYLFFLYFKWVTELFGIVLCLLRFRTNGANFFIRLFLCILQIMYTLSVKYSQTQRLNHLHSIKGRSFPFFEP